MIDALLIFAATFCAVFALGLQSLNVNQGHYVAAAVTSFFISTGNIVLYRLMPEPTWMVLAGYYSGGIVGIVSSMWFHRSVKLWWKAWRARRAAARLDEHAAEIYPACMECGLAAGKSCPRLVCDRYPTETLH